MDRRFRSQRGQRNGRDMAAVAEETFADEEPGDRSDLVAQTPLIVRGHVADIAALDLTVHRISLAT